MKKMRLLVAGMLLTTASCYAQNLNLDTWMSETEPTGWLATFNGFEVIIGGDPSVVEDVNGSVNSAALLQPLDLTAIGTPAAVSLLTLGADGNGIPQATRIDSMYFDGKFDGAGSSAVAGVQVDLTKWNSSTMTSDTIGSAFQEFTTDVANFTTYGLKIVYLPQFAGVQPDSVHIVAAAAGDADAAAASFWVDEFRFVELDQTGLTVLDNPAITVYPTLAKDVVNMDFNQEKVSNVVIMDLAGKLIANLDVSNTSFYEYNVSALMNGTYIYTVMSDAYTVQKQGKIVVMH